MRYINLFEYFEARGVYNVHRRNRIDVEKNLSYGGWNIKYSSKNGKGRALIFDNKSKMTSDMNLSSNEMFLFGIETTPSNSGIGRMLLKDIFDYFDIDTIYLPSMDNHPVWNKIATKTNKSKGGMSIFKIKKEDL